MVRRLLLLLRTVPLFLLPLTDAEAGRRGLRVDVGAWNTPQNIAYGGGFGACPEAGWDAEESNPGQTPTVYLYWGWVDWLGLEFRTSGFQGLDTFTCESSKSYTPGASPEEYLNAAIFPPDEADLAAMIGANTGNSVTAMRYSYLGPFGGGYYGRQWTFYFFPAGLTVVALHGAQDGQDTFEWIFDHTNGVYVWDALADGWSGEYLCFQDGFYVGDCVPPAPPPPEDIFINGFE